MDDLMMMHSEPPKPKLVAMELPGQPGVYWPALKFQSHKDMRMWGRELQSNRNQCSLGELLVNEARHTSCCTKSNFQIVAFPLYADLLVERVHENEPNKSPGSVPAGSPKFREITDELQRNLRSKYGSEKDILSDLESALSAVGAMQMLGCHVSTSVMSPSTVSACNLKKKGVVPLPRSSPLLQRSHTIESNVVSDSSGTEKQETGGADSSSDQDEGMLYDGEGEQNYHHDYDDDEDGQTDQESPSPYQVPEAVELLWRPRELWSVLKELGWSKRGENGPYYRPMRQGESFACFSDVVSFCAMNVDDAGNGTARWCNRAENSANICINQKSFLMWGTLITQLRVAGWKIEYYDPRFIGTFCSEAYLRPGVDTDDKGGLVCNLHYFQDQESVKAFVCKYWDKPRAWLGHYKEVPGLKAVSSEKRRRSSSEPETVASKQKRRRSSEPEAVVSKHVRTVECKPKSSGRKPTKISAYLSMPWAKVWSRLTQRGKENVTRGRSPIWTCKDEEMGRVYFRPGCEGKIMASLTEGIHYFTSEDAVRQFCAAYEHGDEFMEHGLSSNWGSLWPRLKDSGWVLLWKKVKNAVLTDHEEWYLRPCDEAVGMRNFWDDELEIRLGLKKNLHYFTTRDTVETFLRINRDSSDMLERADYTVPAISADGIEYSYGSAKASLATPVGKAAPFVSTTNHSAAKIRRLTPLPVKKEVEKKPTTTPTTSYSKKKASQQNVVPQESLQHLESPSSGVYDESPLSQDPKTPMKSPKAGAQLNKKIRRILLGRGWGEEEGGKILVRPGCGIGKGWKLGFDYFHQKDRPHLLKEFLDDNPELLLTDNALADALRKKGWTSSSHPPRMWIHPYGTENLGEGMFDGLRAVESHIHRFPITLCGENDEVRLFKWLRIRGWEEDEAPSEDGSGKLRRDYQLLSRSEVYRLARINPAKVALPEGVEDEQYVSKNNKSSKSIGSPQSDSSLTSSQDFSSQQTEQLRLNTSPYSSLGIKKNGGMKKHQQWKEQKKVLKFSSNTPQPPTSCRSTRSSRSSPEKVWGASNLFESDMKNSPIGDDNSHSNSMATEVTGLEIDFELSQKLLNFGWVKGDGETWISPGGQDTLSNLKMVRKHFNLRSKSLALLRKASDSLQLGCKCVDETDFVKTRSEYQKLKKHVLMSVTERKGGSFLLCGIAGTGKTLAASILEEELEKMEDKPSPVFLHLQGTASVSAKAAFQDLCHQLERKGGGTDVDDFYATSSEEYLASELRLSPKIPMVVIVVDEIDCLDSNVLRNLFTWAHSNMYRLILIGITNNVNLPNERVMDFQRIKGWKSEHIVFPAYGKDALLNILHHRVDFAVETKAIEFCAKWATNSGCGSARLALNLLLKAVGFAKADAEMCVHSDSLTDPVRVVHTMTAVREFNTAGLPTANNIGNLPNVAKYVLCAAARMAAGPRCRREPMGTTTDEDVEKETSLVLSEEEMERAVREAVTKTYNKISTTQYRDALQQLQDAAMIKRARGSRNRSGSTTKAIGSPRPKDNVQILVPICLIKQAVSNNSICVKILT